jgi:4-methyl-5(b-hydroxyethyl)-thiazole monophosphate biosynthesis
MHMSISVLVPIANGSEELEAITIVDVLRRAEANVTLASIEESTAITASRQTRIVADCLLSDCIDQDFDCIAIPGGMPGADRLSQCGMLIEKLREQAAGNKYYSAICAAPEVVLARNGLLEGRRATGHPMFQSSLDVPDGGGQVVQDGNCLTSQGAGTALEFALTLVETLYGPERRQTVAESLVVYPA